jgi:hypothetical protein
MPQRSSEGIKNFRLALPFQRLESSLGCLAALVVCLTEEIVQRFYETEAFYVYYCYN